ncbi:hypothetical protein DTL21_01235 [Bremerella cremea]|uniref:Uncharacterized protein n=1 Tax=Blastopirellula marina TaxID=124 RepID=A0A2S8G8I1_9BACT|nr:MULTISPECIES: hypothetical protein [Pirellulaceae]PQO40581.1 hypothetical protein C5Y83_01235 [Blastopirellula marina]RCS52163.1 hypothetical protein DTL21_01235 [Bremerella cremea]
MNDSEPMETTDAERPVAASVEEAPPRPTYAPAAMALGVMMLLWGVTTMWIMSVAGLGVMIWSLWTWMNEIRLES